MRIARVLGLCAVALVLSGCSVSTPQVGAVLNADGRPAVLAYPCGGTVTDVQVRDYTDWVPGSDPPAPVSDVWVIEGSSDAQGIQEFTIGETPAGYIEVQPLDASLESGRNYSVRVEWEGATHSPGATGFDLDSLASGDVVTEFDPPASLSEFESRARNDCRSLVSRFNHEGLSGLGAWILIPPAVAALAGMGVLAVVVRHRGRRSRVGASFPSHVAGAPPPPPPPPDR